MRDSSKASPASWVCICHLPPYPLCGPLRDSLKVKHCYAYPIVRTIVNEYVMWLRMIWKRPSDLQNFLQWTDLKWMVMADISSSSFGRVACEPATREAQIGGGCLHVTPSCDITFDAHFITNSRLSPPLLLSWRSSPHRCPIVRWGNFPDNWYAADGMSK